MSLAAGLPGPIVWAVAAALVFVLVKAPVATNVSGTRIDARLPGPLVWAVAGALVAVLGLVLPQWWFGAAAASLADDLPLIAIGLVSLYAQRSMAGASPTSRLLVAMGVPAFGAVVVGAAAYWLYVAGKPELLTARYALRYAAANTQRAADLQRNVAHWLDPRAQALELASMLLFVGFLIAGYSAFRARLAGRRLR